MLCCYGLFLTFFSLHPSSWARVLYHPRTACNRESLRTLYELLRAEYRVSDVTNYGVMGLLS